VTATPGGAWLVVAVAWPLLAALLAIVAGGRHAARITLAALPVGIGIAAIIALDVLPAGEALVHLVGGWAPPLGIALRGDSLSAVMLLTTALVVAGAGLYAYADFAARPGAAETRGSLVFWTLLLALWGAMNLVLLGHDLFNLFVALELLTFAAVPLVCLDGRAGTLQAALRYLVYALLGSVLYLLGAVLLYGAYGTLDVALLAERVQPGPATWVAGALMTAGLLAKTALFPLHLWLPPAPRRRARARERGAVRAGREGLVRHRRAPVVRGDARAVERRGHPADGDARRGGDRLRQRAGAAPGAPEADGRVFDGRADRLPVPDVPACLRPGVGRAARRARTRRRRSAGGVARLREGRHVPRGRAHRHGPRP
jgi:Proton-conducting membrane transporter